MAVTMFPPAYPACKCVPSEPWEDRRDDGLWPEDMYDVLTDGTPAPRLAQRTCTKCHASKCIEVPAHLVAA